MPGSPGAWDLDAIAAWKITRKRDPDHQATSSTRRDKLAAEVRIIKADAERRERENRVAAGGMLLRDNVNREVAELIIQTRTAFRRIPRKLTPRFPQDQADDLATAILDEIDDALTELAKWRPSPQPEPPPIILFENQGA